MGREPGTKGWRVLLETGSIVIRYDSIFIEGSHTAESDSDNGDTVSPRLTSPR
jgi:hypothetical protein